MNETPRMDTQTRTLWAIFATFLLMTGIFVWGTIYRRMQTFRVGARPVQQQTVQPPSLPVIRSSDPRMGSTDPSAIELVQFADYRCLHCRSMQPILATLLADPTLKLRVVWREAPTQDQTREGLLPFIAARCAHQQGKFSRLHNALFTSDTYTQSALLALAQQAQLDTRRFELCLGNESIAESVRNDQAAALVSNIQSSPTFFVRGKPFVGQHTEAELRAILK